MPWAAAAVVGGAIISSDATGSAADSQAQSSQAALAEQQRQFDLTRQDTAPYRAMGAGALDQIGKEVNVPLDPNSVQMDPGYEFARQQGQQAIDRQTAAAGGRISGAALKAASQYNTDYATTGYSNAYNRANQARSDRLNRLAALAGIGQTATGQVGTAGSSAANAMGNIVTAQGNAAGAAQIAQGNIWSGAGNQIAALYGRNSGVNPNYGGGTSGIDATTNLPNYALVN